MQNKQRTTAAVILLILITYMVSGFPTRVLTPEKSGQLFVSAILYKDIDRIEDVMGKDILKFKELVPQKEISEKESLQAVMDVFNTLGIKPSEEQLEKVTESLNNAMNKLECKNVSIMSNNSKNNEVNLIFEMTYFSSYTMKKTLKDKLEDLLEKNEDNPYFNVEDSFITLFCDLLDTQDFEEKTTYFIHTFVKKRLRGKFNTTYEVWGPESNYEFGQKVGSHMFY